jgi:hypothetical protein
MEIKVEEISRIIRKQIEDYDRQVEVSETGTVLSAGDGIARVYGLENAMAGELLEFPHGVTGMMLNLEEDNVGAALLGDATPHQRGRRGQAHRPHRRRARSARPCSAASSTPSAAHRRPRPDRDDPPPQGRDQGPRHHAPPVGHEPLQTGLKAIDSMVPIGRGQRELIIGDRQTGKTAVAIDTIINQKNTDVFCIYVAIGQKQSTVARSSRSSSSTARWSTPSSSAPPPPTSRPAVPRALHRLHDGRVLPRQRQARPDHLRRPQQAGRRLPPDVAAAPPPARPRSLPRRRLLPPQPPARARRQDERPTAAAASPRSPSSRPRPATSRPTSRPT